MDLDDVVREARRQNFTVEPTRNQHLRFTPPDKSRQPVTTGGTPSDKRALQNLISDLRRYAGFVWDRRNGGGGRK